MKRKTKPVKKSKSIKKRVKTLMASEPPSLKINEATALVRKLFVDAHAAGCLNRVWAIVTALRGRDDDDGQDKARFTTPIRQCLLTREMVDPALGVSESYDYREKPDHPNTLNYQDFTSAVERNTNSDRFHYLHHCIKAVQALQEGA